MTEGTEDDPQLKKEEEEAKNAANKIADEIKKLNETQIRDLTKKSEIKVNDNTILFEQVLIEKKFLPEYQKDKVVVSMSNSECGIRIDTTTNENIFEFYLQFLLINNFQ